MTWNEMVRRLWPGISEEDVNDLLWGATCFPFGDVRTTVKQLLQAKRAGRGNVSAALAFADEQMNEAMRKAHADAGIPY